MGCADRWDAISPAFFPSSFSLSSRIAFWVRVYHLVGSGGWICIHVSYYTMQNENPCKYQTKPVCDNVPSTATHSQLVNGKHNKTKHKFFPSQTCGAVKSFKSQALLISSLPFSLLGLSGEIFEAASSQERPALMRVLWLLAWPSTSSSEQAAKGQTSWHANMSGVTKCKRTTWFCYQRKAWHEEDALVLVAFFASELQHSQMWLQAMTPPSTACKMVTNMTPNGLHHLREICSSPYNKDAMNNHGLYLGKWESNICSSG